MLLFIVAAGIKLQAQQYPFSRLDISNGLSNNQVNCFYKDKNGFLWVGTTSGLNRYNGYGFTVFRHNSRDSNSLSDDQVINILEGPNDKLWIQYNGTDYNIFDLATEKFQRNSAAELRALGIPAASTVSILKTKEGAFLFLINQQAIYKYVPAHKKAVALFQARPAAFAITAIREDNNNKIWLAYSNGHLEQVDAATGIVLQHTGIAENIFGSTVQQYSLFVDNENELWLFVAGSNASKNLLRYNPATGAYQYFGKIAGTPHLNNSLVIGIQQDNAGSIWICTDHGGVNIYNKKDNSIRYLTNDPNNNKSLSQNSVTAVYKDNTGIIWLGTYKKGISYYHENIIKFPLYRHSPADKQSLSYDDVNRFVEDKKGNIWIGTNGGGLIYFDRSANTFKQYLHQPGNNNTISSNVIVSLCLDHEGKLWIGSYFGGLDCYYNGTFTHYRHDVNNPSSISDDRIWEIFEDSKQNLWVGTLSAGLNKLNRAAGTFSQYRFGTADGDLKSNYIAVLFEDKQHRLWVGTSNGIDVLDINSGKAVAHYVTEPGSLSNNNVVSMLPDSRGLVWIGTRDRLNVLNPVTRKMHSFGTEHGLPGNTILNILEDDNHALWISTDKGLCKIQVQQGTAGWPVSITTEIFDELDGLQGTEFNENAALKTNTGELLFGGANGFNIFHSDKIKSGNAPSGLVLTGLEIFNKKVAPGDTIGNRVILAQSLFNTNRIQLRYNENILAIEFACINFFNPEKIKYAYRLDGFNTDWVYTDSRLRRAVYTNLDPGTYTFRVRSTGEDGQWADNEKTLVIKIAPPFWQTPLAYLLYALFVSAVLIFARKIIIDRAHMRFEVKQQRREAERIQELDALKTKFFTNVSHEFRTPLSLILSPLDGIVKNEKDAGQKKQLVLVQRNAKRLLNLVNQLLDFRKMEVQEFTLQLSNGDIVKFTKDIVASFSDISEKKEINLSFNSNTGSLETFFDKDKLEKILFNLLSNAFKYTPARGSVSLEINYEPGSPDVVLTIKDSGIGIPAESLDKIFERYFQHHLPGNMHNYGTGIGLAITREFVKLHSGTITVNSEPNKGTCFTVSLPLLSGMPDVSVKETSLVPAEDTSLGTGQPENGILPPGMKLKPDRKTILVVEDNEDLRFYLQDNLQHKYNVAACADGSEGWRVVQELQPDLVVSDIMMPLMTGIELAKKIKTNASTSHIPVILLTAMSSVEKELEGFEAGSNDYIAKPFTFEILASRIKSLLTLQEQMRQQYRKLMEIHPSEIEVTSVDEAFIKRAIESVEKNMDNPDFSVEEMSSELFMSRVSLYKKLLSLTGKSPVEFIRVLRLKRAAQLLSKSQHTVAEVAYEVGFNNPKLFSKYFKEEYQLTPSAYQASQKANPPV
ncbi:MAG TPA: two-component regulator propeller domain-containing protein [Ferruginibacter sp.]|nr:two-component regulator propeller domain-containing protein [Ferruginibacter sp.]HMP21121.1 two-component regulator propeller domain-containing protein [Ferruginibacter sp.]